MLKGTPDVVKYIYVCLFIFETNCRSFIQISVAGLSDGNLCAGFMCSLSC